MKKLVTILLAVSLLLAFAACAKSEKDAQDIGLPNPMHEITAEDFKFSVNIPAGASDVKYFVIDDADSEISQVNYTLDGKEYSCRMQSTAKTAAYDISGIFADKWESEATTVSYCDAVAKTCSEGSVIYWLDVVPGINYTLSCAQKLSAAELSEAASLLFAPMQGDADGDEDTDVPAIVEGHFEDGKLNTVDLVSVDADTYHIIIGVYRLTAFEGEGKLEENSVKFTFEAPDGNVTGRFFPAEDGTYTLCFTDSKWNLLESGTTFEGFVPAIAGGHYEDENFDAVDLVHNYENTYRIAIGIYRLVSFEGEGKLEEGSVKFTVEAPDGSSVTGRFFPAEDDTYTLCFTDSKWNLLESGTTFEGFVPADEAAETEAAK